MILTDNNAGLCFRGENGNIDFSTNIRGEKQQFRRWAISVFEHFWKRARPIE
jgi:predicted transcriptional regulator